MESKRTNLGSFLVVISVFTIIAAPLFWGLSMLIIGVVLVSLQDKTKVDFEKGSATKYYSVLKIPIPFFKTSTDLNNFNQAYLYQISEKGTIQTKVQTLAYQNKEYWIKLKGKTEYQVGYSTYNYNIKDSIQAKLVKNKIEREQRLKK